jgi:hypothetical protein
MLSTVQTYAGVLITAASFLVAGLPAGGGSAGPVAGTIETVSGNPAAIQFRVKPSFPAGKFEAILFGDASQAESRPAISDVNGNRLDGNGDGTPGGIFSFGFQIS